MTETAQPDRFKFNKDMLMEANKIIARYPEGRQASAVMPLLDLAQRQNGGWLPRAAMDHVADILGMPRIRVYEVATFYTMYNLQPVGEHVVQVCTTTPCALRGAEKVLDTIKTELGVEPGGTSSDGKFTLLEVECLGACVNAPMIQIDDDYYEDLDEFSTKTVLDSFKKGEKPAPGPQNGRMGSEPKGGPTVLTENIDR